MHNLRVDSGAFAHNALGNDQMAGLMIIVRLGVSVEVTCGASWEGKGDAFGSRFAH